MLRAQLAPKRMAHRDRLEGRHPVKRFRLANRNRQQFVERCIDRSGLKFRSAKNQQPAAAGHEFLERSGAARSQVSPVRQNHEAPAAVRFCERQQFRSSRGRHAVMQLKLHRDFLAEVFR